MAAPREVVCQLIYELYNITEKEIKMVEEIAR